MIEQRRQASPRPSRAAGRSEQRQPGAEPRRLRRTVGRPRQVEDDEIFRAIATVLEAKGLALALVDVAREVGVTAGAIHQRFASKRCLLLAFWDWYNAGTRSRLESIIAATTDPIEALSSITFEWRDGVGKPEAAARLIALYGEAGGDADLRDRLAQRLGFLHGGVQRLLDAAIDRGQLAPVDTSVLARVLLEARSGCLLYWMADQVGTLEGRLRECTAVILRSYMGHEHSQGEAVECPS